MTQQTNTADQPTAESIVLHQGTLDPQRLAELFSDLALCADVTGILLKGGALLHAGEAPVTLAEARARLESGTVHGVQIRYRFEGRAWCDTLLRGQGGVRVVRMDVTHLGG